MSAPEDIVARIVSADAGHAAAIVLGLPWQQTRAVLAALGPHEVARLLIGARADRVPDLLDHVAPGLLPAVLANMTVNEIAQLIPLLPMERAVSLVQQMSTRAIAELLLVLPTHQRLAIQQALPPSEPPPPTEGEGSDYSYRAEQAVRQIAGRVSWFEPRSGTIVTEIFGRPVQVVAWDGAFTTNELHAVLAGTDWRRVAGLIIMIMGPPDPDVAVRVREARQQGYAVEVITWQDERDDGLLKRSLVRLAS